uniref:Uncharacterized protein n=1 Tax=Brassica oleracea var. oleracea TaxID=109376 RepID=A0A0D3CD97_BRAOL
YQPRIHERSGIRGIFLSHEIVNQKSEQYLIELARDGLKEDIREDLESTEFSTLGALFQEASEVEEILEMKKTPPTSPRRRKRKTIRFGDPEDEHPWDNPEEEDGEESEEEEKIPTTGRMKKIRVLTFRLRRTTAKSSAAEQVSVSGTSSESSAAQGSVCGSNVMTGGGPVGDSSSVSGSNSAQGSSAAQGSISRSNSSSVSGSNSGAVSGAGISIDTPFAPSIDYSIMISIDALLVKFYARVE